jgi:hypothetical protein
MRELLFLLLILACPLAMFFMMRGGRGHGGHGHGPSVYGGEKTDRVKGPESCTVRGGAERDQR